MNTIIYTGILSLLWIVNLFNGTGLDSVYHVTTYTKYLVIGCLGLKLLVEKKEKNAIYIDENTFFIFGGTAVIFMISSEIHGNGLQAMDYLWVFIIVYLLSSIEMNDKIFLFTGWIYGAAGFVILYIYNYGTLLSGWNENSIAMIGMHSFLVFSIAYFRTGSIKSKILLIIATIAFSKLIQPTDSRSGILFLILGLLFALELLPRTIMYGSEKRILIILLVPLMIAIVVVIISKGKYMDALNLWSYKQFQKPVFNGRDELWHSGLELFSDYFLIGIGNVSTENWHNSAITCLVAYGSLGYILWICALKDIIARALPYIKDYLIQGCIVAFGVLYLQQSVELGFISASPSIIPYVMLGIMLGRVKYLKKYGASGYAEN